MRINLLPIIAIVLVGLAFSWTAAFWLFIALLIITIIF